jgi:hypothetical protein
MNIKTEGLGFVKTLAAIGASFGAVWGFIEPMVEDYVHEQVKIVQEEDKKLIEELKLIVEEDYLHGVDKRNEIIDEIRYMYPGSRLRKEE